VTDAPCQRAESGQLLRFDQLLLRALQRFHLLAEIAVQVDVLHGRGDVACQDAQQQLILLGECSFLGVDRHDRPEGNSLLLQPEDQKPSQGEPIPPRSERPVRLRRLVDHDRLAGLSFKGLLECGLRHLQDILALAGGDAESQEIRTTPTLTCQDTELLRFNEGREHTHETREYGGDVRFEMKPRNGTAELREPPHITVDLLFFRQEGVAHAVERIQQLTELVTLPVLHLEADLSCRDLFRRIHQRADWSRHRPCESPGDQHSAQCGENQREREDPPRPVDLGLQRGGLPLQDGTRRSDHPADHLADLISQPGGFDLQLPSAFLASDQCDVLTEVLFVLLYLLIDLLHLRPSSGRVVTSQADLDAPVQRADILDHIIEMMGEHRPRELEVGLCSLGPQNQLLTMLFDFMEADEFAQLRRALAQAIDSDSYAHSKECEKECEIE
jgi:hypothetical protein